MPPLLTWREHNHSYEARLKSLFPPREVLKELRRIKEKKGIRRKKLFMQLRKRMVRVSGELGNCISLLRYMPFKSVRTQMAWRSEILSVADLTSQMNANRLIVEGNDGSTPSKRQYQFSLGNLSKQGISCLHIALYPQFEVVVCKGNSVYC